MDEETRAAFGRIDRYFELAQAQHLELRDDVGRVEDGLGRVEDRLGRVADRLGHVEDRLGRLEDRLGRLEAEFRTFRDWVTARFAELSRQIRDILLRLGRLERQQNGPVG
jgi:septal ring factor EnvC (AmiA/AmiB activator)